MGTVKGGHRLPQSQGAASVLYIAYNHPSHSVADSKIADDDIVMRYNDADITVGLTMLRASQR
jgi:uncharacterized protein YuzE